MAVLGAFVYARLPGGSAAGLPTAADRPRFVAGLHNALLLSGVALIVTAAVIFPALRRPQVSGSARWGC